MKTRLIPHLYETIAQEAVFGILVFSSEGECLFSNPSAVQLVQSETPSLDSLSPGEDRANIKAFTRDLLKHDGFYQDILVRKTDGGAFIANIGVRFIQVDGLSAHLMMLQDVTIQKKLQREIIAKQTEIKSAFDELLKQNQQLRELDLAKDRFIALTTHELRTPLAAMVASAEILKLGLYDTPEQQREFIDMIYEQGNHLQNLVNDILDFAKIQAGKMDFHVSQQDPAPMMQAILRNFEGMAEKNEVTLHLAQPLHPVLCYYDEVRLRQVMENIVNNAIKYNRRGGSVTVHFSQTEDRVSIYVKDTGMGIPADKFKNVFNEFETLGQVSTHHKGTGLGMPISRKLTEGMGGALCLDSELGSGSTFWVELPTTKILPEESYLPRPAFGVAI